MKRKVKKKNKKTDRKKKRIVYFGGKMVDTKTNEEIDPDGKRKKIKKKDMPKWAY